MPCCCGIRRCVPCGAVAREPRASSSTYFDSPDFGCIATDVALRVRRVGRRWMQTLKGPPQSAAGAGLHARAGIRVAAAGSRRSICARLAATPWKKLVAKAATTGGLVPCCTTGFRTADGRPRVSRWNHARSFASIAARYARCTTGARAVRRSPRSRSSSTHGDEANLFRLAAALAADLPLAVMTESKSERGLRAAPRRRRTASPRRCAPRTWRSPPMRPSPKRSRRLRANACTRSPRTRAGSSPTTISSGFTRCGSARGGCARASRSWRRSHRTDCSTRVIAGGQMARGHPRQGRATGTYS